MKTKYFFLYVLLFVSASNFFSCKQEQEIATPYTLSLDPPRSGDNVANLGRVLFYDTHLSVNNSISCASCHRQSIAFSDNVAFSRGFENKLTSRNAPPIQNVGTFFSPIGSSTGAELFWDGREQFLSSMVLKPIVNHVEMGMNDGNAIVSRVQSMVYYSDLFKKAFGKTEIDLNKIAQALSDFTGSITSGQTKFDAFRHDPSVFSALEKQGRDLFFSKYNCNGCHQTQVMNGYQQGGGDSGSVGFVNIGLDENSSADIGRGAITKNSRDNGKFKIPNLRNVGLTAPYMHDGRFATLDDVVNHYSHGIAPDPNLDSRLKDTEGKPARMNIPEQEKGAIIAFLNTLTDYSMITNPDFSNPFKQK